ncbi:MAG: hypothetical protein HY978_00095 [Candidatus Liptonbacteria bacterium]|nr:hypothetical protein [Candidatus Liptonbacteria bacterium]
MKRGVVAMLAMTQLLTAGTVAIAQTTAAASTSVLDLGKKLPGPFSDFAKSLENVRLDDPKAPAASNNSAAATSTQSSVWKDVQDIWDRANSWLEKTTGYSLRQIVKIILQIIVVIFTLIARIIGWLVSRL